MNARSPRPGATRGPVPAQGTAASALIYRGPQANPAVHTYPPVHAPNAALLIDFDNVTMGIQKDLHAELKALLGSEIIRGKVAVQRAYADWRRYPQYIVPLAESSIDMIMAPAYGSSKKNATDIRLAVDAMEIVFTRPEIGTFILLSGDSDFSSLVTKLKEYGKYVIGVGIRESSSDLLVMNCDEYYSYNALTGLMRTGDEEPVRKWDPWELVTEAVQRMKRNGDVMRSDRLKQVMQEIDASFDEKDAGYPKFSKFVQEASNKGLVTLTRLVNGQLEVDVPTGVTTSTGTLAPEREAQEPSEFRKAREPERGEREPRAEGEREAREDREERGGRRGRRGRGRGRDRDRDRDERREERAAAAPAADQLELVSETAREPRESRDGRPREREREREPQRERAPRPAAPAEIGVAGERLTRDEAFDLVRRAVGAATTGDEAVRANAVRRAAFDLLGRDSESLSERNFTRILRDAHDADVIDLRRRGDDFEVARAVDAAPVAAQLAQAAAARSEAATPAPTPTAPRLGMGPRGAAGRGRGGRPGALPPELLSIGIVAPAVTPSAAAPAVTAPLPEPIENVTPVIDQVSEPSEAAAPAAKRGRGRGGRGAAKKGAAKTAAKQEPAAKPNGARAAKQPSATPAATSAAAAPAAAPAAASKRGGRGATKQATKQPAAKQPAAKPSAAKQPAAKQPAAKQPAAKRGRGAAKQGRANRGGGEPTPQ